MPRAGIAVSVGRVRPALVFAHLYRYVADPVARTAGEARGYSIGKLRRDLVAGASVAVVAVPQCMAYAVIAGVPPVYGLYTVIFQCLIGSLLNSQPLLSGGPINTQALLVASIAGGVAGLSPEAYLALVFALTLVKGLFQIGLAAARLGALVRYVSRSVIVGFTAGAGVLIAAGQVDAFLGFTKASRGDDTPYVLGFGLQGTLWRTAENLHLADWRPAVIGVGCVALLLVGKRVHKLFPGPLLAVLLAGLVVWLLKLDGGGFRLLGTVPSGLPMPTLPIVSSDLAGVLVSGGLALALMGLMEAYAIGRSIADATGTRIDANQELFSQGLTQVLSSFLRCIPGSASFSRSALNHQAGAATAFSGIYNALFVLAALLLFGPAAAYVPMSAIAAILFVVAYGLIDWRYLLRARRISGDDASVCATAFAATLVMPLQYAVFLAIGLDLLLQLRRSARLHVGRLALGDQGFAEVTAAEPVAEGQPLILQLEGDMYFATADALQRELDSVLADPYDPAVVLRMRRVHHFDVTAMDVLLRFVRRMREAERPVAVCGVSPRLMRRLEAAGVMAALPPGHVVPAGPGVMHGLREAVEKTTGRG